MPVAGEPVLLVRRVLERARAESPLERIEPLRSLAALAAALASVGLESGARIGLELDVLPARLYLGYGRRLPESELGDCSPAVRRVRARKSDWELARMRAAAEQVRRGGRGRAGAHPSRHPPSLRFN